MLELRICLAFEFGDDALGEYFSQLDSLLLDSPLVERINLPDGALGEHAVFVSCDEFSQRRRGESLKKDRVRRTVAFECSVCCHSGRRAIGFNLSKAFAKSQCFCLRKNVGQENVLVMTERVKGLCKRKKAQGISFAP